MATIKISPPTHESQLDLWRRELCRILNIVNYRVAAYQADSTATTVAELKTDFNALLAKLRAAGLQKTS